MSGIFLNALLWPLLAVAAVPLILHLLSLRRLPIVDLSTFRFLFDTYVQQRRRMKLVELLLLLLRTAFLLLLVLAAMRPTMSRWGNLFGGGGRQVAFVVDCSASMSLATAGVTSLERAKEAAGTVLTRLDPSDRVNVLRLTNKPEVVLHQFAADSPELALAIANLKPSVAAANVYAGLTTALSDAVTSSAATRVVYLFTDLQRTNWRELAEQHEQLLRREDRVFVVNVSAKEPPANRAVIGDPPADAESIVGQPIELKPRVANFGPEPVTLTVRLELAGKELAQLPITVPAGKATTRSFTFIPDEPGVQQGRFIIEGDGFAADNDHLFCLNVSGPVRVLLVNGRPDPDPFRDELVFLRTALRARHRDEPGLDGVLRAGPTHPLKSLDAGSLALEEVRDGEWEPDRLAGVSVVILANCHRFPAQRVQDLRAFVQAGGGLLVFPGDQNNYENLRQLLGSLGMNLPPLVPVTIGAAKGDPNRRSRAERLAALDFAHPVLSVFRSSDGQDYLAGARFYKWHSLGLLRNGGGVPLAQFGGGDLALVENKFGMGLVVLAAFPVSGEWSDLPKVGADFVPLMLRLVSYVRRKPNLVVPSSVSPGAEVGIAVRGGLREPQATIAVPELPAEPLRLTPGADELAAKFDNTNAKGYYRVALQGREPTARREDERPERETRERQVVAEAGFAVNAAAAESDFATLTAPELSRWLGAGAVLVDLSQSTASVEEELTTRQEIWRWLALAMLVAFFAEFMLATLRGARTAAERAADAEAGSLLSRVTGVKPMDP